MILGPLEILNRVNTNSSSSSLTLELIVTIPNSKEILITRIPTDACNILSLGLFCVDSTKETNVCLLFVNVIPLAIIEVVTIVIEYLVLFVLDYGSFHYFQTSFK